MAIVAADIEYRLSGGASNADPNAALGGAMSSSEVVSATLENLFDDVTASEAANGDTEYRCYYITNTNLTDTYFGAVVWISSQTSSGDTSVEIGLDPAGVGDGSSTGVATTIADEQTAPAGVTFSAPATAGAGLSIGDLAPGEAQAVWVKRVVNLGASNTALDDCTLQVRGTTS